MNVKIITEQTETAAATPKRILSKVKHRKKRVKGKPVYEIGTGAARVAVSQTRSDNSAMFRVYWRGADGKAAGLNRRHLEAAIKEANFQHDVLREGVCNTDDISTEEIRQLREVQLELVGLDVTPKIACFRYSEFMRKKPKNASVEQIYQMGLDAYVHRAQHNSSMSQAKERLAEYLLVHGMRLKTFQNYVSAMDMFADYCTLPLDCVTTAHLEEYSSKYENRGSRNACIGKLKKIWRAARVLGFVRQEFRTAADYLEIIPGAKAASVVAYTWVQTTNIVDNVEPRFALPCKLQAYLLFRPEEAYHITCEELFAHWEKGWVYIPKHVAKVCRGSGSTERWVPVNETARLELEQYRHQKGATVPSLSTVESYNTHKNDAIKAVETAFVPDGLRKSAISHLVALHLKVEVIAAWSGNSPATIRKYYHDRTIHPEDGAPYWTKGGLLPVNVESLYSLGVHCAEIHKVRDDYEKPKRKKPNFSEEELNEAA